MGAQDFAMNATVTPAGVATVTVAMNVSGVWTVAQVTGELPTAPANATAVIRKNGNLVAPFEPTGDTVAGDPPVPLRLGDVLTVTWTNCTPGDVAKVYVMYDDGIPA